MTDKKDELLWTIATQGVKPLRGKGCAKSAEISVLAKPEKPPKSAPRVEPSARVVKEPAPVIKRGAEDKAHPSAGLDARTRKKIKQGKMQIEGRIDLHGMGQARAHEALEKFLIRSHEAGKRTVLVITGKGSGGGLRDPLAKGDGVLKRRVPEWVAMAPLLPMMMMLQSCWKHL